MKGLRTICAALISTALLACGGERNSAPSPIHHDISNRNSIYHWKTTFDPDPSEIEFLNKHGIKRVYLRMFDVAPQENLVTGETDVVPIATTKFISPIPAGIEIVPVAYITIDALRAMAGREVTYANLITERLLAMASYNECGTIREIQLDCDWTSTTKSSYDRICHVVKSSLEPKGIELSVTVRLHQLQESAPIAHRGVLMLYNTGALKDPKTYNSILFINDAEPYIKPTSYRIPLDYAYPTFGWGVKFKNNRFVSIVSHDSCTLSDQEYIRYERASSSEILRVKKLVEEKIGRPAKGNILYHLDQSQLKHYSDDEISQILAY